MESLLVFEAQNGIGFSACKEQMSSLLSYHPNCTFRHGPSTRLQVSTGGSFWHISSSAMEDWPTISLESFGIPCWLAFWPSSGQRGLASDFDSEFLPGQHWSVQVLHSDCDS